MESSVQTGQIAFKNVVLTYYLTAGNRDGVFEYKPVWIFSACEEGVSRTGMIRIKIRLDIQSRLCENGNR